MKNLYAQIDFLSEWADVLYVQIKTDPNSHIKEQEIMIDCAKKIVTISKELDKERKVYHNQPLWKKLFRK
jgi:hypothetical protein